MQDAPKQGRRALVIAGVTVAVILASAYILGRTAGHIEPAKPPSVRTVAAPGQPLPGQPLPERPAAPTPTPAITAKARSLLDFKPVTGPGRPPMPVEKAGPYGSRLTTGTPEVALTFDDGPDPDWTPRVLSLLRRYGVKATFCVVGLNVVEFPRLVADIAREGHTLCNHSWSHDVYLGTRSVEYIRADLLRTNAAIRRAAGAQAQISYYRQPGGAWTSPVAAASRQLGMTPLHWTVDPMDWRKPGPGVIANMVSTATRPGSIVLMHDGGGNRWGTVRALESILGYLSSRYRLVALPPGVPPPPPRYVGSRPRDWQ